MPKAITFKEIDERRFEKPRYHVLLHGRVVETLEWNLRGYTGTLPTADGLDFHVGEKPLSGYRSTAAMLNREWAGVEQWYEVQSTSNYRQGVKVCGKELQKALEYAGRVQAYEEGRGNLAGHWHAAVVEVTLRGQRRRERDVKVFCGSSSTYQARAA